MKAIAFALLALLSSDLVIPAGTRIPIRFVQRVTSGRDTVGTEVLVQTMGALVQDSCVLVPPYVRAKGRIVLSRGGGRFGRHGRLGLRFDSLEVRARHWVAISAVLDTLEYAKPGAVTDSGLVSSGKTLRANKLVAVEEIMPVSARLVVNQAALKTRRAELQPLIDAFSRAARK